LTFKHSKLTVFLSTYRLPLRSSELLLVGLLDQAESVLPLSFLAFTLRSSADCIVLGTHYFSASPDNVVVNQLFGSATGLGMGILTFDWSQINWIGSPLVSPWWAEVNIGVGFVLGFWIIVPCLYYTNVSPRFRSSFARKPRSNKPPSSSSTSFRPFSSSFSPGLELPIPPHPLQYCLRSVRSTVQLHSSTLTDQGVQRDRIRCLLSRLSHRVFRHGLHHRDGSHHCSLGSHGSLLREDHLGRDQGEPSRGGRCSREVDEIVSRSAKMVSSRALFLSKHSSISLLTFLSSSAGGTDSPS